MNRRNEKAKALAALAKVIKKKIDIDDAFFCQVGPVCLKYGQPGDPDNDFRKGYGISHIIAKRGWERRRNPDQFPETGYEVARKMMDVLVYGQITKTVPSKQCVHLQKDGFEAVVSLDWMGDRVNWLLTGWKVIKNE